MRELAVLGLDAAPLEREAVVGRSRAPRAGRRPRPSGASCRRRRRSTPRSRVPGVCSQRPPVVVAVAALDLVGGGGGAPAEAVGEGLGRRRHGRGTVPDRRRTRGCAPMSQDAVDALVEAARPRADRGQHLPRASRPTRTASGCSAARWPARPWSPRPAPSSPAGRVHSLHAYFLRPGDPTVPILYEVDRIRDGRSFTTRRVVAIQHGRAIFNLQSQLPRARGGPRPPGADARGAADPRRSPTSRTRMAPYAGDDGRLVRPAPADRHPPRRLAARPTASEPLPPHQRVWLRADGALPDDPVLHACVLTYASDMTLLDTTLLPPRRRAGTTTTCSWPASTTPCGSTARSGPTSGCSTTRTRRRPPAAAGLGRGRIFTADGRPRRHRGAGGPHPGESAGEAVVASGSRLVLAAAATLAGVQRRRPRRRRRHDHHHRTSAERRPATTTTAPLAEGTLDSDRRSPPRRSREARRARSRWPPGRARPTSTSPSRADGCRLVKVHHQRRPPTSSTYELQTTPAPRPLRRGHRRRNERGLLGMAFSTDGRQLYVDYTASLDGHTVVVEYELGDRTDRRRRLPARAARGRPALRRTTTAASLVVRPRRLPLHRPRRRRRRGDPDGQRPGHRRPCSARSCASTRDRRRGRPAYAIPAGNPFADGEDGAPEIWLYGVRNPWRFIFDTATGDLWVGRRRPERAGGDRPAPGHGRLRRRQGRQPRLEPRWRARTPSTAARTPPGAVLPIYEYTHDDGCSVTGGYVYRGDDIPALQGTYLFADYCAAGIRGRAGRRGHGHRRRARGTSPSGRCSPSARTTTASSTCSSPSGPVLKLVPPETGNGA